MTRHGSARLAWSCVCGALVALAMWFVSRSGALLTPDSMSYVGAAHALAEQGALRVPMAEWNDADSTMVLQQFPPGYPVVLAAALRAGVTSQTVVRIVDAFAAFSLVALTVWLCAFATHDARSAYVAAPLLILSVRALPTALTSAWSEPLFLVALVATLLLMVVRPNRSWTYGIAAALGNAVRYAGVSLLLAAVLWAAWQSYTSAEEESPSVAVSNGRRTVGVLRAMFFAGAPGIAFNAWWLWRARHYGVTTPVATVAWMGNLPAAAGEAVHTVSAQLVPLATAIPAWVRVDVALLLIVGIAALVIASLRTRRQGAEADGSAPSLAVTMLATLTIAASYAAMLVYSRLFVGSSIPLDDRLLAPLVLTIGIATLLAIHRQSRFASARVRSLVGAAGFCWLAAASWQSYADVTSLFEDRDDYGSDYWTDTEAADWLRTSGRAYALYSNDPDATYFITGRPSRMVPDRFSRATAPDFMMQLRATNGVLIEYPLPLEDMVDARELARQVGMCIVVTSEVGNVWRLPTSAMDRCADAADTTRSPAAASPSTPTLPVPVRKSR